MRKLSALPGIIAIVAGAIVCSSVVAQTTQGSGKLKIKETSLGKLGAAGDLRSMVVSPDGKHIAVVSKKDAKYQVVRDGVAGKEYEWIVASSLMFTADSEHLAYIVQQGSKMFVVLDGKEGKPYHEIINADIFRPREGATIGYCAKASATGKRFYVINDDEGKEYDQVFAFSFSPDGKRWAYGAESGGKQFFIVDGVPTKEYEKVAGNSFVWSPDSKRVAFAVVREKKVGMVVDGKEESPADEVGRPVFSPDSAHIVYTARDGEKTSVIFDGKPQATQYEKAFGESLVFSPDSKRLAFVAARQEPLKDEKGQVVKDSAGKEVKADVFFYVVDGEAMRTCAGVVGGAFIFSPDSKRTAYVALARTPRGPRAVIVVDGIEGKEYEDIRLLQFSPDSKRLAYLAMRDKRAYAVVDNSEGLGYVGVGNLMFSKDGKRMAYIASREQHSFVVVDSVEGKNYASVIAETLAFSPTGKHVVYQAQPKDSKNNVLAVDGEQTPEFLGLVRGTIPMFTTDNAVEAMIVRENEIFKMQVEIAE